MTANHGFDALPIAAISFPPYTYMHPVVSISPWMRRTPWLVLLHGRVAPLKRDQDRTVALDPCQQITHRLPLDLAQCVMMHLAHQARTLFDG